MTVFFDDGTALARRGFTVLPIVPSAKTPPAGLSWRRWQRRPQTAAEVDALRSAHPDADTAILLRALFDVDTDSSDGERALRDLDLPLPVTTMWTSLRGTHRLYRTPRPLPSRIRIRPGLDLCCQGRYVIVPRSTGRAWIVGIEELADLPAVWHEILRPSPLEALRAGEAAGAEIGERNTTLTRLCGRWIMQGATDAEVIAKAVAYAHRCRPPLSEAEAVKVATSLLQTRQRTRSPEHALLLRARELDLSPTDRLTVMALAAFEHELGRAGETFAAPVRLLASLTGLGQASIARSYRRLPTAGVVELLPGRDPVSGRRISMMRFMA